LSKKRDRESAPAAETLEEIESVFDRGANWVSSNPTKFLVAIGTVLAIAAGYGLLEQNRRSRAVAAAEAVAAAQHAYFAKSGSATGAFTETEPANPEAGKKLREEYLEKFLALSEEHANSVAGIQALFEAAELKARLEGPEASIELLRKAKAQAPSGSPLEGVASMRLATALEGLERWAEAGEAYAAAADVNDFPGSPHALAEAARCMLQAGDEPRARSLYTRLGSEAPDHPLPPYLQSRLEKLVTPVNTAAQEPE
jgi:hypothetical protein